MSLTVERLKEVLHYDPETGVFTWKVSRRGRFARVGSPAGGISKSTSYVHIAIDNKIYKAHRLAWLYTYGCWPVKFLDHKDTVRHHNQIANLREASNSENLWNQGTLRRNKSGFKGVYYHKHTRSWMARCSINKVVHYLGTFPSAELASEAYKAFAEINHGEFFNPG